MRKRNYWLLYLIILCSLLTACSDNKPTYRIGVSQCGGGRWREKVNSEMLAAQHLYDQSVKVEVINARDDTRRQIHQIDSLVNTGIDLLVVAPNEAAPIAEAVVRTREKGIPVIFFDRKAATDGYTAFIGGNNVEAGQIVAGYALELARQSGKAKPVVLEVTATMSTSPAMERHQGFAAVMEQHKEVEYICVNGNWSFELTYELVKQQMSGNVKPDIVFCHNDGMGMGARKAVEELGLEKEVKILGVDGMPDEGISFVLQGKLSGTYVYPTHGEKIVKLALDILTGQPYERDNSLRGTMVTPENAAQVNLNSRELIRQNENLIVIHEKLERAFGLYNTQQKILIASFISILLLIVAVVLTWQAVRQTRKAHRQMKTMHEEQSRFYTNASHQLKTPLTLIAGPMKELADSRTLQDKERALVDIVCRNVSTLESLVSSVLNFRKEMKNMVSDETAGEATMQVASSELIQERRLAMMKHEDTDELSSILIVDDNDDMCLYLKTLLADQFYVLLASNGQDGLKIARELVPDIIVSDVMMPVMDGLQFCRQLKENAITSHIPVILLTARSSDSQQMEGYEHGADAYLTKPFNADVLISRIYNLLKNRQQLLHLFDNQQTAQQSQAASTQDTLFAEQLREAIRKHMSNSSLKMDDLADEVGLGRVQLYRKVKALTGLSPVEVLRQMRLQHARTLLMTTTKTVQEIAYDVGFGTPGYFSKCFKQQYGIYPMDLRSQQN